MSENENDLKRLIISRTSNPLRINHLPNLPDQIGYTLASNMTYNIFNPPKLTNSTAHTITTLTLPCKGVWLINYEIILVNPNVSFGGDSIVDTSVSFLAMSVSKGITEDVQSWPVVSYLNDSRVKNIIIGDNYQFNGSGVYVADNELSLSFNIQSNFSGRIYLMTNGGSMITGYNLLATRIG